MIVPVVLSASNGPLSWALVARPSRPAPPPLQVDTAKVVLAVTAVWVVALVVLLILGDRVDEVWIWTCVCAIVLAGLGLALMHWQRRTESRRHRADGEADSAPAGRQSDRTSNSEVS
jgi:protein-S-isoprenylcysteine O-methyltransferase Ste14